VAIFPVNPDISWDENTDNSPGKDMLLGIYRELTKKFQYYHKGCI